MSSNVKIAGSHPVVLQGASDHYRGIMVDLKNNSPWALDFSTAAWGLLLTASIAHWLKEKKRGIWIKVPLERARFVERACRDHQFSVHHAQNDYIMLTRWLPVDEVNKIPPYCSHYIGVGGCVLSPAGQLLVVTERYEQGRDVWKLPGGLAERAEELSEAAEREVLEETGVRARFLAVTSFRHKHHYRFGASDLYFVSLMLALSTEITADPAEIAQCRWMEVDEFLHAPHVNTVNKEHVRSVLRALADRRLIMPHTIVPSHSPVAVPVFSITEAGRAGAGAGAGAGAVATADPAETEELSKDVIAAALANWRDEFTT